MCCGTYCYKLILLLIIIPFTIVSVAILAIGGVLIGGKSLIMGFLGSSLTSIEKELGISLTGAINQLFAALGPAGWGLLWLGIIMLGICVLGMIGICCKYRIILMIYAAAVGAIFLAQLFLVIAYVARKSLFEEEGLKLFQDEMIYKKYKGDKGTNIESLVVNMCHVLLQGCGAKSGADFQKATVWDKRIDIKKYDANIQKYIGTVDSSNIDTDPNTRNLDAITKKAILNNGVVVLQYPITCCKSTSGFTPDTKCITQGPTAINSNINTGCYNQILKRVNNITQPILIAVGVLVAVPAVLFLFSVLLIIALGKEVA